MLSRRTVLKYTGISGFWGLMIAAGISMPRRPRDGGSEQLPTNIASAENPWDDRIDELLGRCWRSTDESLPKDGEVVLLATGGGGILGSGKGDAAIWVAKFVARDEVSDSTWSFITLENANDLYPGLLGEYKWMPLPSNPFHISHEWDHRFLAAPLADHEQIAPSRYRVRPQQS